MVGTEAGLRLLLKVGGCCVVEVSLVFIAGALVEVSSMLTVGTLVVEAVL